MTALHGTNASSHSSNSPIVIQDVMVITSAKLCYLLSQCSSYFQSQLMGIEKQQKLPRTNGANKKKLADAARYRLSRAKMTGEELLFFIKY